MKISVSIEYRGKEYNSDIREFTEGEFEEFQSIINNIMQSNVRFFNMDIDGQVVYFGEEVLKHSILTIIKT